MVGRTAYYTPEQAGGSRSATIIVTVPANARLRVDDQPTTSTAERRVFLSPPLEPGSDYVYSLQADVERDGRTVTMKKQVTVRAGQESRVTFTMPAGEAAAEQIRPAVDGGNRFDNNAQSPNKNRPPNKKD